ncbi:MAG: sialidase family protein [Nakamurella multipartita]
MECVRLARSGDPLPGAASERPCYRIPALAVTGTGRVVVAWDVRTDWRDLPGPFDLAYRTSDDHGRSWGATRMLRRHEPGRGFGDASLVADPATGRLLCWYAASRGHSYFTARPGDGLELWLATSDDDGESWTHRELTRELAPDWAGGMFAASGNGIALRRGVLAGALLQPFVLREPATASDFAAAAFSGDGGASWELGDRVGPGCDEGKLIELTDGRVLLHARARPRRRWASSANAGGTFTVPEPDEALRDPGCNGGLARWGTRLACTLLDDERRRRRLVLRLSDDEGASWTPAVPLDLGAAGYSVVAELADGALGVAYEDGDYAGLTFCRIAPDEVGPAGAAVTLRPNPGTPGAAREPVTAE